MVILGTRCRSESSYLSQRQLVLTRTYHCLRSRGDSPRPPVRKTPRTERTFSYRSRDFCWQARASRYLIEGKNL